MSRLVFDDPGGVGPAGPSHLADPRRSPRATPMIRPAKVIADRRETLCVVLDVSDVGVGEGPVYAACSAQGQSVVHSDPHRIRM